MMPAADRVARCSSMIDVYCIGMAQPANPTMRAAVGDVPVIQGGAD